MGTIVVAAAPQLEVALRLSQLLEPSADGKAAARRGKQTRDTGVTLLRTRSRRPAKIFPIPKHR
jgi:hypothetical protein